MIEFDLSRFSDSVLELMIGVLVVKGPSWLLNLLAAEQRRRRDGGAPVHVFLPHMDENAALTNLRTMTRVTFALEHRANELESTEREELLVAAEFTHLLALVAAQRLRDLSAGQESRPN